MHKLKSSLNKDTIAWGWNDKTLLNAIEILLKSIKINIEYNIPYLAGYNKNETVIYIDNSFPQYYKNKKLINVHNYVVIHEIVEKLFINNFKLNYLEAHNIALRFEKCYVDTDNEITWNEYNKFCNHFITEDEDEKIIKIPKDLDLRPYEDSKDYELIKKMKAKMV